MHEGQTETDDSPEEVLIDKDLLKECRIAPTLLLKENIKRLSKSKRFHRADALAHL